MKNNKNSEALILVDLQADFLPGGALAVPDGDAVLPIARAMIARFPHVVFTQDWHPAAHESFASQHEGRMPGDGITLHGLAQVLWPDHCVQGSTGAAIDGSLDITAGTIFQKGMDPRVDSYSGFFDNGRRGDTGLAAHLKQLGITSLFVMGLATDYCVRFTALDARSLGFETTLLLDGCRGVDLTTGDSDAAIAEMETAGIHIRTSASLG